MARGNRAANRAAAKQMLENVPDVKEELKRSQEEQMEFFGDIQNEVDLLDEEDEIREGDDNEEREAEVAAEPNKAAPATAPNVENVEAEAEDDEEGDGDEDETEGEEEVGKAAETSKPEAKSEAKPDAEKPAAPTTEAKPEEKKPEQVKTEEAPKPLSPEEATKLYGEWRGQTETLLAEHHYRLDEKDVEELNANPAAYIPKAMARVYMDSISAAFQQFTTYLPRMVQQVIEQREKYTQSERKFFEQWPDLETHRDVVMRVGQAYRQQNPTATMDDFINEVGAQAMVALRLVPQGGNLAPAQPNANGKTTKVDERKPFKPATEGSGAPVRTRQPSNPFEQLAGEFTSEFEEDLDDN